MSERELDSLVALEVLTLVNVPSELDTMSFVSCLQQLSWGRSAREAVTYLLDPVEAILGEPNLWPASIGETIEFGPCGDAVVPDGLGGHHGGLVRHTAQGGTLDDRAPRVGGLNNLNAVHLALVKVLEAALEVVARAEPANKEDPFDSPVAALAGSLRDLGINQLQDVEDDGLKDVLQIAAGCSCLALLQL